MKNEEEIIIIHDKLSSILYDTNLDLPLKVVIMLQDYLDMLCWILEHDNAKQVSDVVKTIDEVMIDYEFS